MVLSVATMFVLTFSIVSMAMGFGALYPRFKHENIAQVSMGFGGLSYMIASSAFNRGCDTHRGLARVPDLHCTEKRDRKSPRVSGFLLLHLLSAVMAILAAAAFKPMKKGIEALERYEG